MRLIIEARIVEADNGPSHADNAVLAVIERSGCSLNTQGRSITRSVNRLWKGARVPPETVVMWMQECA